MSQFHHPGSIEITSWKDDLPHYIKIKSGVVVCELGQTLGDSLCRYDENEIYRKIADHVIENHPSLPSGEVEDAFSSIHKDRNTDSFGDKVEKVEDKL
jgi:hypothetical protein